MSTAERRIIYDDPTRGMDLVSVRDESLEKTRYLFFAGQVIDPDRVSSVEHIAKWGGGEELQTHCMRRSVGGLLPRAQMMPLEVWADAQPPELIGEGLEHETVSIRGAVGVPQGGGVTNRPGFFIGKSLKHVRYYPGDEIKSIMRANDGKGIVEVKALFDAPWYDGDRPGVAQLLNADFFPIVPPIELSRVEEMIDKASGRSDLHSKVAVDMKRSCDQFRRWAEVRLSVEHAMLRERKSHQHVYTYSPVARELLRQLEMPAQDRILDNMAGGISAEQLREILANVPGGANFDPQMIGVIAGEVAKQFMAAQAVTQQARQAASAPVADAPSMASQPMGPNEPGVAFDAQQTAPQEQPVKNKGGRPRKNPEGANNEEV